MNISFTFKCLFLFFVCPVVGISQQNKPQRENANQLAVEQSPVASSQRRTELPGDLDSLFEITEIPFNFFNTKDLSINAGEGRLDSIEVLKALFPGPFFQDYYDWEDENVVVWGCSSCPKLRFEASSIEDPDRPWFDTLPYPFLNFTKCIRAFPYTESGKEKHAFFFNTSDDIPGSGRFHFGALGAAIFEKNNSEWILQSFTPVVCGEGRFNRADPPGHILQFGEYTFFELQGGYAEGAGAGYLYGGEHLFALHDGRVQRLFFDVDAHCKSYDTRLMHWKSKVLFQSSEPGNLPDIELITTGHFELNDDEHEIDLWKEISWWPGLQTYLGENTPADFEMRRLFHFDGATYKAVNCTYAKL